MREIKFRGQDFETGEWIYGSYNGVNAGAADVFIIYEKEIFDPVSLGFIDTEIVEKEVKEETVGQYTGLKDKNGVEIFEGDILRWTDENNESDDYQVIFEAPSFKYAHLEHPDYIGGTAAFTELEAESDFEVIGNIYENPELLKEAK